jgi:alpha-1,3-rhamnosyl/mannosyltransferase
MGWNFRKVFKSRNYDLYHEPNFLPLADDFLTVATFHDLSVLRFPQWHPADRVAHFELHMPGAVSQCAHIIAVSEFTRQEVIRLLNVPPDRITTIYNGIRAGLRPLTQEQIVPVLKQLGLPPRYLLYVGTLEPRKNILRLLQAYCDLPQRIRSEWPLLLVGSWGWKFLEIAEYLYNEARHRGVIHLGYVPDRHLAAIYGGARVLLYPSIYEGFGLPPLEMMACGGAVVTSTAGALVETAGAHSHRVHPEDIPGWRDAMARVVEDDDWWLSLRQGVVPAVKGFTWENCAGRTLDLFRSVLRGGAVPQPAASSLANQHRDKAAA